MCHKTLRVRLLRRVFSLCVLAARTNELAFFLMFAGPQGAQQMEKSCPVMVFFWILHLLFPGIGEATTYCKLLLLITSVLVQALPSTERQFVYFFMFC